jgi:hypothetical protein
VATGEIHEEHLLLPLEIRMGKLEAGLSTLVALKRKEIGKRLVWVLKKSRIIYKIYSQ